MKKAANIVVATAFHPIEGGIETFMYQVAKNWNLGESIVYCQGNSGEEQLKKEPFSINCRPAESRAFFVNLCRLIKRGYRSPWLCFLLAVNRDFVKHSGHRVLNILDDLKPDADFVIQSSTVIPNGAIGVILKKILKKKLVVYIYGSEINRFKRKVNNRLLMKHVFSKADRVISISGYTSELMRGLVRNPDVIRTVNIGVDTDRFFPMKSRPEICEMSGIPMQAYVFLTMGRLIRRKGHDQVLKALALIRPRQKNIFYIIAGRGPEEDHLKQLARKLGIYDHVRFVGFVKHSQVNAYMNACDCFIMPNREENGDVEGYGLVFIEANACGKPVIAGKSGGAVEAVKDNVTGLLVDPRSVEEIAAKMELIMRDHALAQRLASAGLRRAREELAWEKVCTKINNHIVGIMD
ncbi:MAG: glycosyltransferase family 4 protein [Candidatus Aminicenantes bacterium]|nr:glycosyltransferase family 4 protein [Candidatus Aminicenantes bacterium]